MRVRVKNIFMGEYEAILKDFDSVYEVKIGSNFYYIPKWMLEEVGPEFEDLKAGDLFTWGYKTAKYIKTPHGAVRENFKHYMPDNELAASVASGGNFEFLGEAKVAVE